MAEHLQDITCAQSSENSFGSNQDQLPANVQQPSANKIFTSTINKFSVSLENYLSSHAHDTTCLGSNFQTFDNAESEIQESGDA